MPFPPDGLILALLELDCRLIGLAVGVKAERKLKAEDVSPLYHAVRAQHAAVKGNRPDMGRITWDDLRLALAGTLRLCLEYIEGVKNEPQVPMV